MKHDLTRKARLVAGGHKHRDVPAHLVYSSVASRDSVRICLMLAALNGLDLKSADIGNAYLNARCKERVHVKVGPELFGKENEGKTAVIVQALYGLRSLGNAWRNEFSTFIVHDLGYKSSIADPDVYLKPCKRPDGTKYYSYLIIYVDDVLCIHHNPKSTMDMISGKYRLKAGIEDPKMYLGTDVRKWNYTGSEGTTSSCWALGSTTYVKEAIRVAESLMKKNNLTYSSTRRKGMNTPFSNQDYRPKLDCSGLCNHNLSTIFQNLIGILRWICELGRVDILHETSILSQYLAQPRMGHLTQCLNIFYYLKNHDRSWMLMDPNSYDVNWVPRRDESSPMERAEAMRDIYSDAKDELPHNMPEPLGESVDINTFVDADHAGNKVTRRSHTGILIYCNMAPVVWFSKKQNTIESSTFGSEFIALKIATELIEGLRYKLQMFGVPLSGPARIFCNNKLVVINSSHPDSALKKKHCSIAYHKVREAIAAHKQLVYYEKTETNLADLLTKPLHHLKQLPLIDAILS